MTSFASQSSAAARVRGIVAVAALSVVALPGASGCLTKSCTAIGCGDNYTVKVTLDFQQPAPAGNYVIKLTTDAGSVTASCPLPSNAVCCGEQSATASFAACPVMQGNQLSRFDITIQDRPTHVTLDVSRDGTAVGSLTFAPHVRTYQPNGKDCPPTCHDVTPVTHTF